MGQHKYNQTAILAKEGKLEPKEHRTYTDIRREAETEIYNWFGETKGLREIILVNSILRNLKK